MLITQLNKKKKKKRKVVTRSTRWDRFPSVSQQKGQMASLGDCCTQARRDYRPPKSRILIFPQSSYGVFCWTIRSQNCLEKRDRQTGPRLEIEPLKLRSPECTVTNSSCFAKYAFLRLLLHWKKKKKEKSIYRGEGYIHFARNTFNNIKV